MCPTSTSIEAHVPYLNKTCALPQQGIGVVRGKQSTCALPQQGIVYGQMARMLITAQPNSLLLSKPLYQLTASHLKIYGTLGTLGPRAYPLDIEDIFLRNASAS